jgi:uncharacterized protein (DUF305 family)
MVAIDAETNQQAAHAGEVDRHRPWWSVAANRWVAAAAIALVAAALGWLVGNNRAIPDPNDTDIGFLHDMSLHHEQAINIAYIYLQRPDTDPVMQDMAYSILGSQNLETGRMLELLTEFGEPQQNESELVMGWMGSPIPLSSMPGIIADDRIDELRGATGAAADELFAEVMIEHHEGGLQMMSYAIDHADTAAVQRLASRMLEAQQFEIDEINLILGR